MKKIISVGIVIILVFFIWCGRKQEGTFAPLNKEQLSIENRDYVVNMAVKEGEQLDFTFEIADLGQYQGGAKGGLAFKEYSCLACNITEAIKKYYEEYERQLDLGHLEEITVSEISDKSQLKDFFLQLGNMPGITKSAKVILESEGNKEIILRELIKEIYAGEEF